MPTDDDDVNETYEYEQWRNRELKRLKLDKDEREEKEREKQEIERRRKMTDVERLEENKRLGTDETERKEKSKYQFLQKYYHKGAFFQNMAKGDEAHIYNRDYNAPVEYVKECVTRIERINGTRRRCQRFCRSEEAILGKKGIRSIRI